MKKKFLLLLPLILLATFISCSKQIEKPKISISQYNVQAVTSKGLVEKILNESDYKKMHEIALAVESSRAVNCISISDDCNILGQILNKIVQSTNEGLPNEENNIAIYKLVNQMNTEFIKGQEILAEQWKAYINAHANEQENK
ncbi:MAG: hypothetical protein Q7U04_14640 [Bacteriovorax sp.]|nr:hypothetical protein [Bacteriovorax sp.]